MDRQKLEIFTIVFKLATNHVISGIICENLTKKIEKYSFV